MNMLSGVPIMN